MGKLLHSPTHTFEFPTNPDLHNDIHTFPVGTHELHNIFSDISTPYIAMENEASNGVQKRIFKLIFCSLTIMHICIYLWYLMYTNHIRLT